MKHILILFFSCIFLLYSCKSEAPKNVDDVVETEDESTEEVEELTQVSESVIEQKEVEAIIEKKVEIAKSADELARESSPFKGMSCNDVLKKMESTISEKTSNIKELEQAIAVYITDIIPSKDCIVSDEGFKSSYNRLKRKAMEILNSSNDVEESEY